MFKKIFIGLKVWFSLWKLPKKASKKTYVFFDYYVTLGFTHDTVMIYDTISNETILVKEEVSITTSRKTRLEKRLTIQEKEFVFKWLKNKFKKGTTLWLAKSHKDPVRLHLFAREDETGWSCQLIVDDVKCNNDDILYLRMNFIDAINGIIRPV